MPEMPVVVNGLEGGPVTGSTPIVILGPNGSGKTKLAIRIAHDNQVAAISAQRRTWVDDSLPVQEEANLRNNVTSQQNTWRQRSWQPTEDVNFILSAVIQDHTSLLTKRNDEAVAAGTQLDPIRSTQLMKLRILWTQLFPMRQLEIGGFFPKVKRLDQEAVYTLKEMSDGERTVLYMAARIMTAEQNIILVDEPELHMHSKLAVSFWSEAERLRPDCRFIYVTHDLTFALSRRNPTVLVTRQNSAVERITVDQLPKDTAADVLGAATLPFYARRIFLYEGEPGKGFASELFSAWFDDAETFAFPTGDRSSVLSATSGLRAVGVAGAEVIGLVDRDFYPEAVLQNTTAGVTVLAVHEIESILCDRDIVTAIAAHLGKDGPAAWSTFIAAVKAAYKGQTLSAVVAKRVRARIGDLLDGAFGKGQIVATVEGTSQSHQEAFAAMDLPARTKGIFDEETERIQDAIDGDGMELVALLPGKHLLNILAQSMELASASACSDLLIRSLGKRGTTLEAPLAVLGTQVEAALLKYLPPRRVASQAT